MRTLAISVEEVRALRDKDGTNIVVTGSINARGALIENGLVDEVPTCSPPWSKATAAG